MVDYSKVKPTPDAIPTIYGWANPKTGEMLVSVKGGCENPVENYFQNQPWVEQVKVIIPEPIVEVVPEEVIIIQQEPVVEVTPEIVVEPIIVDVIAKQPKEESKTSEVKLPKNIKPNVKS